jgi:energy-coupling factor transporter ATP-binding protein EcfA2
MSIGESQLTILGDESALEQILEWTEKGHFCALLGPSRSGKTFTLRKAQAVLQSGEGFLGIYINLERYEFFSGEIAPDQALTNFFFQLTWDVVSEVGMNASKFACERNAGGAGLVRALGTLARSEQRQIVLFLDHFEMLPASWGHALLGALRAVYDQRLPSSPYFRRVTVVIASSVNIFEVSLGKTSPLSIARMVTTNDLARQQVEDFLQTTLGKHNLTVSKQDLEEFYEATLGNRNLTITLCRDWIEESSGLEAVIPFEELAERFLSRIHQNHRVGLMISQIEENTDVLIQVLDLVRGVPVKRRTFRTGLSELELTGVVRSSKRGFAIHNPLFEAVLRGHFTPERVIYLLDKPTGL